MLHEFHPHSEQFMEFDEDNSGDIGMCSYCTIGLGEHLCVHLAN